MKYDDHVAVFWKNLWLFKCDKTLIFHRKDISYVEKVLLRKNEPIPEFVDHYGWARLEEDHLYYTGLQIESTTPFFSLD